MLAKGELKELNVHIDVSCPTSGVFDLEHWFSAAVKGLAVCFGFLPQPAIIPQD